MAHKVQSKFSQRVIPNATVSQQTMVGQGFMLEQRPYFLLRRGLITISLYITQFGQDLYVSLASYLKPPLSQFRVAAVGAVVLLQVLTICLYPLLSQLAFPMEQGMFGTVPGTPNVGILFALVCVLGPLSLFGGLFLFLVAIYSFYKWWTEKDAIAFLRSQPTEFNYDDLMAMEKAVEETVRQSLTELQLNPNELQPTTVAQPPRIRLF